MRLTVTVSNATAFGAFSCCRQEGKTQTPLDVPKSRFICDCTRKLCQRLTNAWRTVLLLKQTMAVLFFSLFHRAF